jgi:hypothetical protein
VGGYGGGNVEVDDDALIGRKGDIPLVGLLVVDGLNAHHHRLPQIQLIHQRILHKIDAFQQLQIEVVLVFHELDHGKFHVLCGYEDEVYLFTDEDGGYVGLHVQYLVELKHLIVPDSHHTLLRVPNDQDVALVGNGEGVHLFRLKHYNLPLLLCLNRPLRPGCDLAL